MDEFIKNYELENLKQMYPVGCRVELEFMTDEGAPIFGTQGEVMFIDSLGTVFVNWDNGSSLGVIYKVDSIKRVE